MDEQIKAAAVLVRPDAANLAPNAFLSRSVPVSVTTYAMCDGLFMWCSFVGLGCSSALQPWPSPRTGVCKRKAVSQGPGTQRDLRALQRDRVCRSGWNRLQRAEGRSPLSHAASAAM